MGRITSRRPSPATVMSAIALLVALSGPSYGAVSKLLPKNSVGSAQVVNGSLQTIDLSKRTLAALKGRRGPQGPQGPQGAQGGTGPAATTLWADGYDNGTVYHSSGVLSTSVRTATGNYRIPFNRDISSCAWIVSKSINSALGVNVAAILFAEWVPALPPSTLFVGAHTSAGTQTDAGFSVAVFC